MVSPVCAGDIEITAAAKAHAVPAQLLRAVVQVESGANPARWRFEPHYRYLVNASTGRPFRRLSRDERSSESPPQDFLAMPASGQSRATEWIGQQCSWGPGQIMGAVAREHGFTGNFLELCTWGVGMDYAAMYLGVLYRRFVRSRPNRSWTDVIAAYNAGSPRLRRDGGYENQGYVDKVLGHIENPAVLNA